MAVSHVGRSVTAKTPQFPDSSAWDRTGFLLWHAVLEWHRKVTDGLARLDLTHAQFVLLASAVWLAHHGEVPSQIELASHAGVDPMMTSQVVRLLERQKFVRRVPDKNDARVRRIEVTSLGRRKVSSAIKIVEKIDLQVFGGIDNSESFRMALRQVADRTADGARRDGK
jgi:DNA-binding MarR family transcriptional regulator